MGKIVTMSFEGNTCSKLANGLNLYELKKIDSRGCSDPALGLYTCILPFLSNKFIRYLRSQMSVYRTIGPLVLLSGGILTPFLYQTARCR